MNKTLVVGKNSSLWKLLKGNISFGYDEVSHRDVVDFELLKTYETAIVFSYSKIKSDNALMLSALSVYAKDIIYISSVSCEYAELGYKYSYPNVKLFCEQYLQEKNMFRSVDILRLGIVVETYKNISLSGKYYKTNLECLVKKLDGVIFNRASVTDVIERVEYPFSSKIERNFHQFYKSIQNPSLISLIVTRSIDVLLKIKSISWYGYSERID